MRELQEMEAWECDQVDCVLPQVCYVLPRIPYRASQIIHDSANQAVLITVSRGLDLLVCYAHLV